MTRRDQQHRSNMIADINITPFTDVVLVLLIIFMVATPIIAGTGIKVHLPQALTSKPDDEKFLTVTIDAQENIYLHDRKITVEQLTQSIRDIQKKGSKVMLKINGDKSIKYRTVIKVLTAAGDSGVVRYLLVAERIKPSGGD